MSIYFVLNWLTNFKKWAKVILDETKSPKTLKVNIFLLTKVLFALSLRVSQWMAGMTYAIKHDQSDGHAHYAVIPGDEAARIIAQASHEPDDIVGFDKITAERLGVSEGMKVGVTPIDSGKSLIWIYRFGTHVGNNRPRTSYYWHINWTQYRGDCT